MQEDVRFKFALFALFWVAQCCNGNLYYFEMYRPWYQHYPVPFRYPYGYLYDLSSFPYSIKQLTPTYFNAIAYPAVSSPIVHQGTPEPPKNLTTPIEKEETSKVNIIEPEKENKIIKEVQIEPSKDSAPMRDKSLLVNIFDPLLGNRKAVNILANFPNFKLTRTPSGSKTISIQGLSVG